ncbi:MAG: selenocysteine-specific translation elongation factor [Hyphomonadaceae bacterium]|nr:selenocysteine-specific translation elongation factor [Hyphomonadaceae bacterium]
MTDKTIAVIGHVDHGKTALVKALTGTDTDTLAEERARGLTIALGFAHFETPSGMLHLIDTPGHADFVRTTAAGLSGVEAVLLAVSAVEGIGAQTREHVKLARSMGLDTVIVALTKSDLADEATIDLHRDEIATFLSEIGFAEPQIVLCSAQNSTGIDALASALNSVFESPTPRPALPGFYLPVDRVFTSAGAGTIVTGTLIGASIETDSPAIIAPSGIDATVREIQVAGAPVVVAEAGSRVALNLRGVDRGSVHKGDVICAPDKFAPSARFDVALRTLAGSRLPLRHMQQVMVMSGTAHIPARVRLYSEPSRHADTHFAQLVFMDPQVGYRGQRLIVRNPATAETLCGATIIDPVAQLIRRDKPLHLSVLEAANESDPEKVAHALADRGRGEVQLDDVARLIGAPNADLQTRLKTDFQIVDQSLALRKSDIEHTARDYLTALENLHKARPVRPHHPISAIRGSLRRVPSSLLDHVERSLAETGRLVMRETDVALPDHDPIAAMSDAQRAAYDEAAQRLTDIGLRPALVLDPDANSLQRDDIVELLIANGVAVRLFNHALKQHILLHSASINAARERLRGAFPDGKTFTTGEARATLQTNRKTIVPLLEYLDQSGVTQRDGDTRAIIT